MHGAGRHPIDRFSVGIAARRWHMGKYTNPMMSGVERIDARELSECPLDGGAKRVVAEAVHRGVVLAASAVKAVLLRETIPALPYARRALLDFVAPAREFAALKKAAGEIVTSVGAEDVE